MKATRANIRVGEMVRVAHVLNDTQASRMMLQGIVKEFKEIEVPEIGVAEIALVNFYGSDNLGRLTVGACWFFLTQLGRL